MFWLILALISAWGAAALWVQFAQARPYALAGLAVAVALVAWARLGTNWGSGFGWIALFTLTAVLLLWFFSMQPRQDRDWARDVSRIVKGQVEGDIVRLDNIRSFRWQSATEAEEAWTSRVVDLTKLTGADMITSSWGNPMIAHLLVSFRFADADPLTFSVEIRREKGEKFSALGGFFRQFELSLIAADEADIVQWRAVARGEEVHLYPLDLTPAQLRAVFLSYVELGNELNAAPAWYNTALSNCVTVVWRLARELTPGLPLDKSLILPGYLPDYLNRLGVLTGPGTLPQKRERSLISPRARAMPPDADFSAWIRE
nr:DUF4105 domain-containing protein [Pseudogemmobacter hezensis]